ncbi:MAG TPA: S41 family peptidase [Puia sp.]|jgi:hypothetical protein|nr:S41 family peptidase [Puia sp.]
MQMIKPVLGFMMIFLVMEVQAQNDNPSSTQKVTTLKITPEITHQLIDSIRKVLVEKYIFRDTAIKMVDYLEKQYKRGIYDSITDPTELERKLYKDLRLVHRDVHFRLIYAPGMAKNLSAQFDSLSQKKADSTNVVNMQNDNYFFHKVEILSGNIGYIKFNGFTDLIEQAKPTLNAAFRFVMNTKALIIDLRENRGGSPDMVSQIESYFFPGRKHMNDIVTRSPDSTIVFWTDPKNADGIMLSMPVYMLTSKSTVSGAEDLAYAMQSVHRAVIIGDTTAGGAHPTGMYNIGFGFIGAIPVARTLNPYTHTDWEGTGVYPDIPVSSDEALKTAERLFFKEEIGKAGTVIKKRQLEWTMKDLLASQSDEIQDSQSLVLYTGNYTGGLIFYVQGHYLYCRNKERGNRIFKLKHIEGNEFVLDDRNEIQFVKNESGKVTGCRVFASSGEERDKTKE